MRYRVFNDEFKKMAVELSRLKSSVKQAAIELDLDPSRLSKWRNNPTI
nr:transposase [uncultured Pedobacter sp.]